jgi:hypothetical protein
VLKVKLSRGETNDLAAGVESCGHLSELELNCLVVGEQQTDASMYE